MQSILQGVVTVRKIKFTDRLNARVPVVSSVSWQQEPFERFRTPTASSKIMSAAENSFNAVTETQS